MELSPVNFTGKTIKIRGNKKFISPNANLENILTLRREKASRIKTKDLKLEQIQKALEAPKNGHNVKMALKEYLNLNYYC